MLLVASPATVLAQVRAAPDFVLKDLRGRKVRLSSYKGKIVLLNFWATWCPPCRAEMPELVTWQREYRARGLQVIGVTYPPINRTEVRRFVRRIKANYPIVLGTKETKGLFSDSETLPITVVIDREGKIRDTIEGILLPEEFEEKIRPLLKQSSVDSKYYSSFENRFMKEKLTMRMKYIVGPLILALVMSVGVNGASASSATVTIRVEGMHCGGCASSVEKKLKATKGVLQVRVSFEKKEAWVEYDDQKITVAQLRAVINSAGFQAVEEKGVLSNRDAEQLYQIIDPLNLRKSSSGAARRLR